LKVTEITDTAVIRQQIHDYIVANFLFDTGDVKDDTSLIGQGVLDSTGVLEMVLFLEERLSLSVSDEEVLPEHFDSVDALVAFVTAKMGTDGSSGLVTHET
jgi:acyl carrier protein